MLVCAALKVAKSEHSNVLLANAFHHRSDAFGSLVAVGAIVSCVQPVSDAPMTCRSLSCVDAGRLLARVPHARPPRRPPRLGNDPQAGCLRRDDCPQGACRPSHRPDPRPKVHELLLSLRAPSLPPLPAYSTSPTGELESPSSPPQPFLASALNADPANPSLPILAIPSIRVFSSGPSFLLDVLLVLPGRLTLEEATRVEELVIEKCTEAFGGPSRVREVVVRLKAEEGEHKHDNEY